ncbi:MAG: methionine--tRNA ligase [SAR324 cluster bacterium]|uniref:Methionine--tRNA ligase n=1 Tax=SAR324 cluster bacterium TaxID=2024889 RepID=A0A7X9FRN2_9DELT|nr:methionine--tRNA ligase [SAR324 cluster bacterium]
MEHKKKRVLVTSALPYSNGILHVGHIAGAYLPADIYVRFLRLNNVDVRFVCGSDDHGVAIMITAEKEGKTPAEVAEHYHKKQKEAFDGLGISFDTYSSTSRNPYHYKTSQDFFLALHRKGYFQKKETLQFFDPERKVFLPDRYVKGECAYCGATEQNGDQCENCGKMLDVETLKNARSTISGKAAIVKSTKHWFLDLSRFEKHVNEWLDKATIREHTKNYVKGLLSVGLVERSMTRDISWGIPVPLEDPDAKGKVLYVWFDAPIGYISNTKELCAERDKDANLYADWWKSADCEIYHFIGEDNTIFHSVIWIAMLQAEGTFQLPKGVIVNQFLNIKFPGKDTEKISKSRGTAIWLEDYLKEGGNPDVLRYYLTAIAPEGARSVYKPEDLIARNNGELGNVVGNFVNRIISFTRKYCGPEVPEINDAKIESRDIEFEAEMKKAYEEVRNLIERFSFRAALERIMEFARECNRYIDEKAPWTSRKSDMEKTKISLVYALNAIKGLGLMLNPFMPFSSEKMLKMLSLDAQSIKWKDALTPLKAGQSLAEPEILFPKIESDSNP